MKLGIVKFKSDKFAKMLPKDKLWLLQGINEDKNGKTRKCYFARYNGKLIGIIYDLETLKKNLTMIKNKRKKKYKRFCCWCGKIEYTKECESNSLKKVVRKCVENLNN